MNSLKHIELQAELSLAKASTAFFLQNNLVLKGTCTR